MTSVAQTETGNLLPNITSSRHVHYSYLLLSVSECNMYSFCLSSITSCNTRMRPKMFCMGLMGKQTKISSLFRVCESARKRSSAISDQEAQIHPICNIRAAFFLQKIRQIYTLSNWFANANCGTQKFLCICLLSSKCKNNIFPDTPKTYKTSYYMKIFDHFGRHLELQTLPAST